MVRSLNHPQEFSVQWRALASTQHGTGHLTTAGRQQFSNFHHHPNEQEQPPHNTAHNTLQNTNHKSRTWLSPFLYSSGQSSSRMRGFSMRRRIFACVTSCRCTNRCNNNNVRC
jgi:hypothetical protein